jgi:thioredoxin-related protein
MRKYTAFVSAVSFLLSFPLTNATPLGMSRADNAAVHPVFVHVGADTASSTKEPREKFDPTRDAVKDIAEAVGVATKENKRILLDVGGEWCIWCHKLDRFFDEHKDVADFLHANYTVVKVNYSKENKNEKLLSTYPPVKGYPHLFVLDNTGKLLHSQDTGELESGDHHDHDKVLSFLKAWAPRRQP